MDVPFKILHAGWAFKLGSKVKNWKRRWFVLLSNGNLRYFEDKDSFQEKGHLQLDKMTAISIAPATKEGVPLQIINSKRILVMKFQTREEADEWSEKLNSICS